MALAGASQRRDTCQKVTSHMVVLSQKIGKRLQMLLKSGHSIRPQKLTNRIPVTSRSWTRCVLRTESSQQSQTINSAQLTMPVFLSEWLTLKACHCPMMISPSERQIESRPLSVALLPTPMERKPRMTSSQSTKFGKWCALNTVASQISAWPTRNCTLTKLWSRRLISTRAPTQGPTCSSWSASPTPSP